MGFTTSKGSNITYANIVWGSKNKKLPVPNIRFGDKTYYLPEDPDHQGEDHPRGSVDIKGLIKNVRFENVPSYTDNETGNGEKNMLRMSILVTSTDDKDYLLTTDLVEQKLQQYHGSGTQLLASLGEMARTAKESPDYADNMFQFSFYRTRPNERGHSFSNSTISEPVDYDENAKPIFERGKYIRAELPPKGIPTMVGDREVYDNTPVKAWLEGERKWVEFAFGEQQQETQEEISTEGLAEELAPEAPRG